jgi:hypothetical protein
VEPNRCRRGFESRHALREQPCRHSSQHIAGPRGREVGRRIRGNGGAAVGRRNNRIPAFEHHDSAADLCGKARPFKLRSDFCSCVQSPEVTRKFAFMRGEDRGPAAPSLNRLHKPLRMPRETRDGIGVEHDGALARQSGKHEFAGRFAEADAGADRQRVEPDIGQDVADGFYEWRKAGKTKVPIYVF